MIFTRIGCLLNGCWFGGGAATAGSGCGLPDHTGRCERRYPVQLLELAAAVVLLGRPAKPNRRGELKQAAGPGLATAHNDRCDLGGQGARPETCRPLRRPEQQPYLSRPPYLGVEDHPNQNRERRAVPKTPRIEGQSAGKGRAGRESRTGRARETSVERHARRRKCRQMRAAVAAGLDRPSGRGTEPELLRARNRRGANMIRRGDRLPGTRCIPRLGAIAYILT